ncbi:MAG: response regulator [Clostridiaceae bacterium]|nr:response regulator [Clostridiaceae bacterium]
MRIIIADDEWLIRESLKSMLKEINFKLDSILEADNGEELINLAKEHTIDIAFVDIRMPNLNGLDAIEKLKEVSPYTQFVVLTGYSEFQYVKEAIRMGVANYLLKPVSPEELKETINVVTNKNKVNMKMLNGDFEKTLSALFNKVLSENEAMIFNNDATFIGGAFCFDSFVLEDKKQQYETCFYNTIKSIIDEIIDYDSRLGLLILSEGYLVTVGAWDNYKGTGRETVFKYFTEIRNAVLQSCRENFKVTFFNTGECKSLKELSISLNEINKFASLRTVIDFGHVSDLISLKRHMNNNLLNISKLLINLSGTYSVHNYVDFIGAVNDMKLFIKDNENNITIQGVTQRFLKNSLGIDLKPHISAKELICELESYADKNLLNLKRQESYDMVSEVKKYVHSSYMNNIGIGDIAEKLKVTPNYLSTLFHKKTGINFVKYLTQFRMRKAKELLVLDNKKVKDVSKEVGYFSTRHFTKLFKEHFGYYPSECADMVKNKKID